MTEQEEKEIVRVCGKDYDYLDIPAYIRKRDEDEARALCQLEEEWRQEEAERLEKLLKVSKVEIGLPLQKDEEDEEQ